MTTPVVRLADARFGYAGTTAVRADLGIERGQTVAILGANGSGKSTMVKGTLGLVDHLGGTVEWFGQPLRSFRERWLVGYVPQREMAASPIPVTVEELVRSGRVARRGLIGRPRSSDREAVDEALRTVGLADRARTPARQLSGGQQRRALVARALAGEPEVLVLDEPFAGVDRESQDALADTFRDLAGRGVTLIVVLHELGPLDGVIDRAISLAAGEVVYDGPPDGRPTSDHDDHDPHGGEPPATSPGGVSKLGLFPR